MVAGVEHKNVLWNLICKYVIDVGANRGQFVLVSSMLFPEAKIFSIEPLREPAEIFSIFFSGNSNVLLFQCAIGWRAKKGLIHITKDDNSSSLLPISDYQTQLYPNTTEKENREIEIRRLAGVID